MRSTFVLTLVLGLLLADVALVQAGESARPLWWGPNGMTEGWHVRIPVAVDNPSTLTFRDATVGRDVDVRAALASAGWTFSRSASGPELQGFEFDPESVRVVEYRGLGTDSPFDGFVQGEVPSRAWLGSVVANVPYDATKSPAIHVEWALPGETKPGTTRYFMIYLDSQANGPKAENALEPAQQDRFGGRYYISRGTTLYGMAQRLIVTTLEPDTEVTIEGFNGGRARPIRYSSAQGNDNPYKATHIESRVIQIGTAPVPIRITANKPVLAVGLPPQTTQGFPTGTVVTLSSQAGPVPSVDGNLVGRDFTLPLVKNGYILLAPEGTANVEQGLETHVLEPSNPWRVIPVGNELAQPTRITSDSPIMVWSMPPMSSDSAGVVQGISPWGAPASSSILSIGQITRMCDPLGASPSGFGPDCPQTTIPCTYTFTATASGPQGLAQPRNGAAIFTAVGYDGTNWLRARHMLSAAYELPSRTGDRSEAGEVILTRPYTTAVRSPCFSRFDAMEGVNSEKIDPSRALSVFGGFQNGIPLTAIGGRDARLFNVYWPTLAVAYYPATELTVTDAQGQVTPFGLTAGELISVVGSRSAPVVIESNKPLAVLSIASNSYFVGIDETLRTRLLPEPDYRGYLLDLMPAGDGTEPVVALAGAGHTATYELNVRNLAKDHRGNPVADRARLSLPPTPLGWTATLSEEVVALPPGGSKTIKVFVTPDAAAPEGSRLSLAVTAASEGNPRQVDRISTLTLVRATYGVELWFHAEGGPKTENFLTRPAETKRLPVVIRNKASVPDRLFVSAELLGSDWSATFAEPPGRLVELDMDAGEIRTLTLLVTAPDSAGGSQSILEIVATSTSNLAAVDKVLANLRIKPQIRLDLEAPTTLVEKGPGEHARLPLILTNQGKQPISVRFNVTGVEIAGWGTPSIEFGSHAVSNLAGISPGSTVHLNATVRVGANASRGETFAFRVRVETIPQFVGDTPVSDAVDLKVLTARRHDLTIDVPVPSLVVDETGRSTLRLVVENRGNGAETLRIVPSALVPGAVVALPAPVAVPVGETHEIEAMLAMPLDAPPKTTPLAYRLVADDAAAWDLELNLTVPERRFVTLEALEPAVSLVGLTRPTRLAVKNDGNVPLTLPPQLVGPAGWQFDFRSTPDALAPGERIVLDVEITLAPEVATGPASFGPDETWARGEALAWEARKVALVAERAPAEPGSTAIRIRNTGTGDAVDVLVELEQAGDVRDTLVLRRIPAGEEVFAVLAGEAGPARVVVDGTLAYGKASVVVETEVVSRANVPSSPVTFIALAVALAAIAVRFRRLQEPPR